MMHDILAAVMTATALMGTGITNLLKIILLFIAIILFSVLTLAVGFVWLTLGILWVTFVHVRERM